MLTGLRLKCSISIFCHFTLKAFNRHHEYIVSIKQYYCLSWLTGTMQSFSYLSSILDTLTVKWVILSNLCLSPHLAWFHSLSVLNLPIHYT